MMLDDHHHHAEVSGWEEGLSVPRRSSTVNRCVRKEGGPVKAKSELGLAALVFQRVPVLEFLWGQEWLSAY